MTAQSAFHLMQEVRVRHIDKSLYYLCPDPRFPESVGLFVDDWQTVEAYPLVYASGQPSIEEIALYAADDFMSLHDNVPFGSWYPFLHALILAAIEEARDVRCD